MFLCASGAQLAVERALLSLVRVVAGSVECSVGSCGSQSCSCNTVCSVATLFAQSRLLTRTVVVGQYRSVRLRVVRSYVAVLCLSSSAVVL